MTEITNVADLEALYGTAVSRSLTKVATRITPHYARWITAARFCVLTTVGPEGSDGSPRGDIGPVARIVDDKTLHIPDWRGNNRLDSLRNIVRDGRVSLMFMVPNETNVVRVNGTAVLSIAPDILAGFNQKGRTPKTVIVMTVGEAYFQCAKAIMRSELWGGQGVDGLPSAGDFLKEQETEFDAKTYDATYADYAKDKMW